MIAISAIQLSLDIECFKKTLLNTSRRAEILESIKINDKVNSSFGKGELKNVTPGYKKVPVVGIITPEGEYNVKGMLDLNWDNLVVIFQVMI